MASDLSTVTPWTPPEAKTMSGVVKYGLWAAIGLGAVYAFTRIAPTMVDAITLLDTILQDATHMAISAGLLIVTLFLLRETLSPTGSINRLLRLPYWMFVNGLTRFFITIDPLSPIDERIKSVQADKDNMDQQAEKVAGIVSTLREQESGFRQKSSAAQKLGIQAHNKGVQAVEDVQAHNFGTFRDTADNLAAMRGKLEPILTTFQQISQACDITIQKLQTEREVLKAKWDAQQAVGAAVNSANRVLGRSRTQVWDMAEQAESIIDTKYGDELGHLEHLKSVTEPLMQSIDLENASFSEEMLQQVQSTGAKLIQATAATTPAQHSLPETGDANAALAGFLRN